MRGWVGLSSKVNLFITMNPQLFGYSLNREPVVLLSLFVVLLSQNGRIFYIGTTKVTSWEGLDFLPGGEGSGTKEMFRYTAISHQASLNVSKALKGRNTPLISTHGLSAVLHLWKWTRAWGTNRTNNLYGEFTAMKHPVV